MAVRTRKATIGPVSFCDGKLATGQNPASFAAAAREMLTLLK
jgi:putative intracellular protease/amidase